MKVQSPSLVCNLQKYIEKLSNSLCKMVKVEVVQEDVGIRKNGAKAHVIQKYFPTPPKIKLQKRSL